MKTTKLTFDRQKGVFDQETAQFFALEEFKEALKAQEFERCEVLVGAAKASGVEQKEITEVIDAFIKKR